jgi:hypothetical protein
MTTFVRRLRLGRWKDHLCLSCSKLPRENDSWFHAVSWTIYAQEKPSTGERGAGCDLSLQLKQSNS